MQHHLHGLMPADALNRRDAADLLARAFSRACLQTRAGAAAYEHLGSRYLGGDPEAWLCSIGYFGRVDLVLHQNGGFSGGRIRFFPISIEQLTNRSMGKGLPMKGIPLALLAALSAPASAERWIEYDIFGSGSYDTWDVYADPTDEWGHVQFQASLFVELDPAEPYDAEHFYWSDGHTFSYEDDGNPVVVSASDGTLKFQYGPEDCDYYICNLRSIELSYSPGSLAGGLPDKLPHLRGGTFYYLDTAHYTGMEMSGGIWRATAKEVDGPGEMTFSFNLTPAALPEPASWAMLMVGFGLIGGALRASRRAIVTFS